MRRARSGSTMILFFISCACPGILLLFLGDRRSDCIFSGTASVSILLRFVSFNRTSSYFSCPFPSNRRSSSHSIKGGEGGGGGEKHIMFAL